MGPMGEQRRSLPVFSYREQLLRTIGENRVTVVEGETGSGTFVPSIEKTNWNRDLLLVCLHSLLYFRSFIRSFIWRHMCSGVPMIGMHLCASLDI